MFLLLLQKAIFILKAYHALLRRMKPLLKGRQGKMLQFLNTTDPENSSFITPEWPGRRKGAKPVGQCSYITHSETVSGTEFRQPCYFLRCQEPHNGPFS